MCHEELFTTTLCSCGPSAACPRTSVCFEGVLLKVVLGVALQLEGTAFQLLLVCLHLLLEDGTGHTSMSTCQPHVTAVQSTHFSVCVRVCVCVCVCVCACATFLSSLALS